MYCICNITDELFGAHVLEEYLKLFKIINLKKLWFSTACRYNINLQQQQIISQRIFSNEEQKLYVYILYVCIAFKFE